MIHLKILCNISLNSLRLILFFYVFVNVRKYFEFDILSEFLVKKRRPIITHISTSHFYTLTYYAFTQQQKHNNTNPLKKKKGAANGQRN